MSTDPTDPYTTPTVVEGTVLDKLTRHAAPRPVVDTDAPILPMWIRDKQTRDSTVKGFAKRNGYRLLRFLAAVPRLAFLLFVLYPPRGLWRLVGALSRYLYDWDSAQVRHTHAGNTETKEYLQAQNARRANLNARWMVAGTIATAVIAPALAWTSPYILSGIVGAALFVWIVKLIPGRGLAELGVAAVVGAGTWWFLPWALALIPVPPAWSVVVVLALVVLALGVVGRPVGRALVKDTTLLGGQVEPLRAPIITAALVALGNSKMKEPESIRLLGDVHRHGPGVQADLELPVAVTAAFVQKNREEFAAALRRELGTVWPSVGKRHPGHLVLFVSDQVLAEADQEPWPLLKSGEVDLFKPFPAFTDQRGQWVPLQLAYANMIIGSIPRMGKTFVLRQALLAAGLDKRAKVYAFDGKGTGDLASVALYAHCYVRGARIDQPERIEKVRAAVRELRVELGRRADIIDSLTREEAPESKVTSELVNARPDLNLGPIVVGFDETQAYFGYGDDGNREHKAIRQELKSGVTELVKLGPALGIIVLLATQQVKEETLPSSIAQNAVIRFCLKIEGHEPNDRVLGTGAYKRGIDAQMFDLDDKGIGYLKSDGATARIVRSVFGLDSVAAERVALRGRLLREAAGLLSGDACDDEQEQEEQQIILLDDVREVMDAPGEDGRNMSLTRIREALTNLRSGFYGHLDNEALGGMLRNAGVVPKSVHCPHEGRSQQGVKREWLDIAATDNVDPDGDDEGGSVTPIRPSAGR